MSCKNCSEKQNNMTILLSVVNKLNEKLEKAILGREKCLNIAEEYKNKYEALKINMGDIIERCKEIARH